MENNKLNTDELREKILLGLDLTMKKLIKKKQQEDGEFVFSENGKIVFVKARDIKID